MGQFAEADIPWSKGSEDHLGLANYAGALANFLANCETPLTVGVQGEWGSGKTSLMNMVHEKINKLNQDTKDSEALVHFLRFETWQYGAIGEDQLLGFHLMSDMVSKIAAKGHDDGPVWKLASRLSGLVAAVGKATAVGVTNVATQGVVDGSTFVDGAASALTSPKAQERQDLAAIKATFAKLVARIAGGYRDPKKKSRKRFGRFIVFVDDLDRIRPGRAVAMLEVLKNFMDVPHCVFVIACDYDVVREGVKERLGITDREKVSAFFHKIFQVPFQMPVRDYRITGMLQAFLERKLHGHITRKNERTSLAADLVRELGPMVEIATQTNPRAFKRFLNVVDLLSCVAEHPTGGDKPPIASPWLNHRDCVALIGLVALQTRWPEVSQHIVQCHGAVQLQSLLLQLSDGLEEGEDDQEADISALLYEIYGDVTQGGDFRQNLEVQQLFTFSDHLFRLLDHDGNGTLSAVEAKNFFEWSRRLSLTGVGQGQTNGGAWYVFREAVEAQAPKAAAVCVWLAKELWNRRSQYKHTEAVRQPSNFFMKTRIGGSWRTILSIKSDGILKLNTGPEKCSHLGLPQIDEATTTFVSTIQSARFKWTLHSGRRFYTCDMRTTTATTTERLQLREQLLDLLRLIDTVALELTTPD